MQVAIFVISAATLAGWIVLFVQFSNIMTKVHHQASFLEALAVNSIPRWCILVSSSILLREKAICLLMSIPTELSAASNHTCQLEM